MPAKKIDPREAAIDRTKWKDDDVVLEALDHNGKVTRISRRETGLPALQIRGWLRVKQTAGGAPVRMRVLQPFRSRDGIMFFPDPEATAERRESEQESMA